MKWSFMFIGVILFSRIVIAQTNTYSSPEPVQSTVPSKMNHETPNPFKGFGSPRKNFRALNIDNYYSPKIQGVTEVGNVLLLRGVFANRRHMVRVTLPFVSVATPAGYKSGIGNFNIFDIIRLTNDSARVHFGIGPLLSIPSATSSILGVDQWQFGGSVLIAHVTPSGVIAGGLVTYRTSVFGNIAGQDNGGYLTFQPALLLSIGNGLYGRSMGATCIFDFNNKKTLIPLGVGIGQIFKAGNAIVNIFIEPAFSVYSEGKNLPAYQILIGMYFFLVKG
ncbi:MAG: hypothetical protein NVV82_11730 [Sporocytophaga sp.]|nr:hypothetical protein [Sporocytophaga sp.]